MRVSVLMRMRNMISMKVKIKNIQGRHFAISDRHTATSFGTFVEAQTGESLRRSMNGVCKLYFETGDHHNYDELLTRARMASLYNRRRQDIAILMYKVKFKYLFSVSLPCYNLRNSNFSIPRFYAVKYGKHSIRNLGP